MSKCTTTCAAVGAGRQRFSPARADASMIASTSAAASSSPPDRGDGERLLVCMFV